MEAPEAYRAHVALWMERVQAVEDAFEPRMQLEAIFNIRLRIGVQA
jgi:hypothetical protein